MRKGFICSVNALSVHHSTSYAAVRSAKWAYLNYGDDDEVLYDMEKDPKQYTNVVGNPEYAPLLKEARAAFEQRVKSAGLSEPVNRRKKKPVPKGKAPGNRK